MLNTSRAMSNAVHVHRGKGLFGQTQATSGSRVRRNVRTGNITGVAPPSADKGNAPLAGGADGGGNGEDVVGTGKGVGNGKETVDERGTLG